MRSDFNSVEIHHTALVNRFKVQKGAGAIRLIVKLPAHPQHFIRQKVHICSAQFGSKRKRHNDPAPPFIEVRLSALCNLKLPDSVQRTKTSAP